MRKKTKKEKSTPKRAPRPAPRAAADASRKIPPRGEATLTIKFPSSPVQVASGGISTTLQTTIPSPPRTHSIEAAALLVEALREQLCGGPGQTIAGHYSVEHLSMRLRTLAAAVRALA